MQARLDIKHDPATIEACWNVFQSSVKQVRYRIKKKFFAGVPADKIIISNTAQTIVAIDNAYKDRSHGAARSSTRHYSPLSSLPERPLA